LSNELNKKSYSPSAGTTVFDDWDIPYFDDTDVVVTIESALGVITEYVDETNFEVVATNGDPENGATITLNGTLSGGTAAGDTVVISRQVPYTQEYNLQNGSSIDATALNKGLDRTVAQSQQLLDDGTRHLTHPITDPTDLSYEAPSVALRASKALGYDSEGNVIALDLADSGTISGNAAAGIDVSGNIISAKVDGTTVEFSGGDIALKNSGVSTAKISDNAVTLAKIETITDQNVLGNVSGGASVPANVPIVGASGLLLDEDTLSSDSATKGATQQSIKAYVDGGFAPSTYTGQESLTLPNGLIMKMGRIARTGTSTQVTFDSAFAATPVSISVTAEGASALSSTPAITSRLSIAFVIASGSSPTFFDWIAIGY
jgi:hypothetical protein